jgi:hypothetical protein
MKNTLIIPAILLLFVTVSCKKQVDELPPATQTGANTFGARVDGKIWTPADVAVVASAPILEARYYGDGIIINARNYASTPTESEFEIYVKHLTGPGTYPLNVDTQIYPSESGSYAYYVVRKFTPINEWITSTQYTGSVNITLNDTTNRIISGTFQFDAMNLSGTPQLLHVTDGRFDVKVQY